LIHLSHKHGLRCGQMIFVGGQVDKDSKGAVLNAYDQRAQTQVVMRHIDRVLAEFGAGLADVVKLVAFYVTDGSVDEDAFLADVARALGDAPGPAITLVPLPWLAYPGMMVEIEAIAMLGADGRRLATEGAAPTDHQTMPAPFRHGLRCGEMIYVGAQVPRNSEGVVLNPGDIIGQSELVMDNLARVLGEFGASLDDTVKFNIYYRGDGTVDDWRRAAEVRAAYFSEPGPAATGLPLPLLPDGEMVRMEVMAMLGENGRPLPRQHAWPEGHWDWPIHLPYKHGLKCGDMIFIGGQVSLDSRGEVLDAGDMVAQTHTSMDNVRRVLEGFGLAMDDVVKVNGFYKGEAGPDTILTNQRIRSACFTEPGPASTGIPLKYLAIEGLAIEVEAIAMTR
jgi:enamine deaminase RidA (YjgF/YER057c/UK114 family)